MPRTRYCTATSLDGFIADPANSLDWLLTRTSDEDGQLNPREFTAGVGAMAMGSTTYEWIIDHDSADNAAADDATAGWTWPPKVPCWVFTHRRLPVVPDAPIQFTSGDVGAPHEDMVAAAGDRDIWIVGGGDLAGQFADVGLLDEVIVAIAPVTLGGGASLLPRRIELAIALKALQSGPPTPPGSASGQPASPSSGSSRSASPQPRPGSYSRPDRCRRDRTRARRELMMRRARDAGPCLLF